VPAKPSRDQPGGSGDAFTRLNWIFEITQEGDYFGKNVRAETSAFLSDSPFNQFRNWAEALLQPQLDLGQVLDESDLIGLPALITVKYEEDRKDSSKKWARVDEVISVGDAFAERPSELIPAGLGQSRPARPPISHPVRGGQRGL
jgi:hypothetical protein